MKALAASFAAIVVCGCAAAQSVEGESAALDWISGCWAAEDGDGREVWSRSFGGIMFGYNVTEDDGEVVFFEDLRIEPRDGGADYVAYPGGGEPTRFASSELGPSSVVFVNAEHDYPQRVAYARDGDRLTASISLIDGSNEQNFAWTRCGEAQL